MSKETIQDNVSGRENENMKFSQFVASSVVTVTVGGSLKFYLHAEFLLLESEIFIKALKGPFKEAEEYAINLEDEDPELFGFFVEYMYRDRSILSKPVAHYSNYITLARLYAMGERLVAQRFQAYCLWRFSEEFPSQNGTLPAEGICDLLEVACNQITERANEDPLRSQILWYSATRLSDLQKFDGFRQLLYDIPKLGEKLSMWVKKGQPPKPGQPTELLYKRFTPESEYPLRSKNRKAV